MKFDSSIVFGLEVPPPVHVQKLQLIEFREPLRGSEEPTKLVYVDVSRRQDKTKVLNGIEQKAC